MSTVTFNRTIGAYGDPASGKSIPATHVKRAFNNSISLVQGDQAFDQQTGAQVTDSSTGTVNDLTLADAAVHVVFTGGSALTVTGVTNGRTGRVVAFINRGSSTVKFTNNDASSLAANRIIWPWATQGQNIGLGGRVQLQYNGNNWYGCVVDPGAPIAFSPTIISSGGGTPTYTTQAGLFVQRGSIVHVQGRLTLATLGTLAAGNLSIGALPLTALDVIGANSAFSTLHVGYFANLVTAMSSLPVFVQPNDVTAPIRSAAGAVTSVGTLTKADITATFDMMFSGDYAVK